MIDRDARDQRSVVARKYVDKKCRSVERVVVQVLQQRDGENRLKGGRIGRDAELLGKRRSFNARGRQGKRTKAQAIL